MAKIVDPDSLFYADYTEGVAIDPSTALNGGPANMLIDYQNKRFALTAPRYGSVGTGVSEMVGFGATGGVSGQALYSKFKNIWKEDEVAIRFPFPMEAITPESFEFINGWLPDETTQDSGNGNVEFITRKLIKDAGWAERSPSNTIGRRYFGTITLGANALGPAGITTVYYNPVNPGIQTSMTVGTDGSVDATDDRVVFDGVVGNGNEFVSAPYFYTGDAVVYQTSGAEDIVAGLTTNSIYYLRYADTDGAVPTGVGHSFSLHNTRDDALSGTSPVDLTGSTAGVVTFTAAGVPEEFFFGITDEGSFSNEPILFFDTVKENNVSAGSTVLYNHDNFYEIFVREEGKSYGKQNNTDIGVSQISNQAYRFPLTSATDINVSIVDGDGTTTGIATASYAGIGISFFQAPQTINITGVGDRDFNIIVDANGQALQTVYSKVQYLLRQPIRVNSGIAGTDINSLSGIGYNNGDGLQNEFNNSFRYGAIQQPLLQFTGSRLDALAVDDIFNLTNGGTDSDNLGNLGIYISNVAAADINNVRYLDNNGNTVDEAFTSTVDLTFNNNLFNDGSARFWVFYDEADSIGDIIPGLSTSISREAGTQGVTPGIINATNEFVVGAGPNHPFVNGQKVVVQFTAADTGVGIAATTDFDPRILGATGQGITTAVYYVNAVKSVGVAQTYPDITESGDNSPGSTTLDVVGAGQTDTFRLHNTYSDAVANNFAGINTIVLTAAGSAGIITFTQLDVNFAENNATIVKTGATGGNTGEVDANTFMDGIDIPDSGEITFSYDYESNDQRNRTPGNATNASDAAIRVVAVGLQTGQYASATASVTRAKNQAVSVTGALERVYSDPA
jgi:hypothetical protein